MESGADDQYDGRRHRAADRPGDAQEAAAFTQDGRTAVVLCAPAGPLGRCETLLEPVGAQRRGAPLAELWVTSRPDVIGVVGDEAGVDDRGLQGPGDPND